MIKSTDKTTMKEIKAIIQPFMLSKVINALKDLEGLPGVTVDTSGRGFGKGRAERTLCAIPRYFAGSPVSFVWIWSIVRPGGEAK